MKQKDLNLMRSHFMGLAISARKDKKLQEKYSTSWFYFKATESSYRYTALSMKKFWPIILGVK